MSIGFKVRAFGFRVSGVQLSVTRFKVRGSSPTYPAYAGLPQSRADFETSS